MAKTKYKLNAEIMYMNLQVYRYIYIYTIIYTYVHLIIDLFVALQAYSKYLFMNFWLARKLL